MPAFNQIAFIKKLLSLSPRELDNETEAGILIMQTLKHADLKYKVQKFINHIPATEKIKLEADGRIIACRNSGFKSGIILNKHNLVSSLLNFNENSPDAPNINFNPYCPAISLVSFYAAPAFAISQQDLPHLLRAKKIRGEVKVKKTKYQSFNILVGNLKQPKAVFFTHYDSILRGATDNAAGVSALLAAILTKPRITENNLFVFSGAEELSYEQPTYWGFGYRVFEKRYLSLLKKTGIIIVVDSVGNDLPYLDRNPQILYQALPLKNFKRLQNKMAILRGNIDKLMSVYHSELDDLTELKADFLEKATAEIIKRADV